MSSSEDEDAQEMARMRAQHRRSAVVAQEAYYEPDALRAHFPLSFGKHSSVDKSAEVVIIKEDAANLNRSLNERLKRVQEEKSARLIARSNDDGIIVGPPPPSSQSDDILIGPPPPPPPPPPSGNDDDERNSAGSEEEEEDDDEYHIPLTNEISLGGHSKVVSALAVDPSGSRVLTGSYDYTVRMYDFQGMDSSLKSFRHVEPFEGHQVRAISWSPSADRFLAVTGSAQAKIYDRDGLTIGEFIKGDMYIRDLKHTNGHISGLTGGQWHPSEKNTALTSSEDGSLRIWDVTNFKTQKQVIKPKQARPGRISVTACAWGLEGKCIAGGLADGSIQIWNIKPGWGSRPDIYLGKAHAANEDVTCIRFSSDGRTMVSRSTDSTLKIWDIRMAKDPLKAFTDLPNLYPQTNVAFSPDERLILSGTSVAKKGNAGGLLVFFDKERLELVRKVGISASASVISCLWHPRLNQIFASTGNKVEGKTHVFYDPMLSNRGALVCAGRTPRKKSIDDFEARPVVRNPHALPMFRDEPSRKRQREKSRSDPVKSRRPDLPITGPGHGGRVGTTKGSLLTQYLLKEGGLMKETWMEEDPREAILKYADMAASHPQFIDPAYAETQPKPVFADPEEEEPEEEHK